MFGKTFSRRTRWITAGALGLALVAGAGTAVALAANGSGGTMSGSGHTAGRTSGNVKTTGFPSGGHNPGIFTDRCDFTHEAADDPIMAPDKPGQAMHHEFFGNTATSASSTPASLVGGHTTCTTSADASGYWLPVLYQNGKAITPKSALIYWRQKADLASKVKPMPAGMQIVAGNAAATAPQSKQIIEWSCQGRRAAGARTMRTTTPHSCANNQQIKLTVDFPSCWDGHTLDGSSRTNVVYPSTSGCPSSHPVEVPQIVFHVKYAISSASGLTLSMTPTMRGSTDTAHADFMNGWNQATLTNDVTACIASQTRCGPAKGARATPQGPSKRQLRRVRAAAGRHMAKAGMGRMQRHQH